MSGDETNSEWRLEHEIRVGDLVATITSKEGGQKRRLYCYMCSRSTGRSKPQTADAADPVEEYRTKYFRPRDIIDHKNLINQVDAWIARQPAAVA